MFFKKAIKNFAIFIGKHLCWSQETPTQVLSCEYYENFKNTYFEEYLRTAASIAKNENDATQMPVTLSFVFTHLKFA